MCELLGANCALPTDLSFSLSGFRVRAGQSRAHADGFGAAFFSGPLAQVFVDDQPGCSSALASHLVDCPIRSTNAIIHIRKATQGVVSLANSHPFCREWRGRHWVFAHNGHLRWRPDSRRWRFQPIGETDSERAFCWMLCELARAYPRRYPTIEEAHACLAQAAKTLGAHGEFNFLASDGRAMYARCGKALHWVERCPPFGNPKLRDLDRALDLSQTCTPDDRFAIVATDPLTVGEKWSSFKHGEISMFVQGRRIASLD